MNTRARNEPLFSYGPEISLGQLPPTDPNKLLQAYIEVSGNVSVSQDFLEVTADKSVLAYLMLPPVTLMTVNMLHWTGLALLLSQIQREKYPQQITLLDHIHIPRIFQLANTHQSRGSSSPLRETSRGRNVFAFKGYAAELIHVHESDEPEWLLKPSDWDVFALKKHDRVFFIKEETP